MGGKKKLGNFSTQKNLNKESCFAQPWWMNPVLEIDMKRNSQPTETFIRRKLRRES